MPISYVRGKDEIGSLMSNYNRMVARTNELIQIVYKNKIKEQEMLVERQNAELLALHSQINPHFLFNTLNVISGMAKLEEAETTEKMILALSSLFRYNLKTPEQSVPLAKELKVVADYMYLQQMRFGERIRYELNCKVEQELVMVPAFTFQPLVENAIIHGVSPKEEGGSIRIVVRQEEMRLHIVSRG